MMTQIVQAAAARTLHHPQPSIISVFILLQIANIYKWNFYKTWKLETNYALQSGESCQLRAFPNFTKSRGFRIKYEYCYKPISYKPSESGEETIS